MNLFVTGATGVIGRRALPLLISHGHSVTAIARSRKNSELIVEVGGRPASVDLFDLAALNREVAGHDAIINLATHMPASSFRMILPGAWERTISSVASLLQTWLRRPLQAAFTCSSRNPLPRFTRIVGMTGSLKTRQSHRFTTTARLRMLSERRDASPKAGGPASCCASALFMAPIRSKRLIYPACP